MPSQKKKRLDPQSNRKAGETKVPVENAVYDAENSSEELEYLLILNSIMDEWKTESDDVYR